ncbi:MAG: N-acetylmuramic acid 6-phosphate etherase [Planctomycetes bacterium]|nr:N-acetylmuramic acid 6-phosphate etherase [Planctomycetota bacterium]
MTDAELPTTERALGESAHLDRMTASEIVDLMIREDRRVVDAVHAARVAIARAVELVADRLECGGRLFYVGAGTSGRLGVLDASECPPTFGTAPDLVVGIIAGGDAALRVAIEGAEDDRDAGRADLRAAGFGAEDAVVGVTASGTAPYVLGAIEFARVVGGLTIGLCCNAGASLSAGVELPIEVVVGPEVLSGSTRLKAGTATKLVLNMLSTGVMVRLGKCFGNAMVDLQASNAKLRRRAERIVRDATGLDAVAAAELLAACDGEVKTSIVAARSGVGADEARGRLRASNGRVRGAIES